MDTYRFMNEKIEFHENKIHYILAYYKAYLNYRPYYRSIRYILNFLSSYIESCVLINII